ncbi:MAG: hypothetical protein ACI4S0_04455 [Dorea sp.]
MKKYFVIILISAVTLLSGCGNAENEIENIEIASEGICENDLEGIIMENLQGCVSAGDINSSNPFDYMDNEYYENIKSLGEDAIPVLLEGHQSEQYSGLMDYLAMYLVWDISGNTDAKELGQCENAEQMYDAWIEFEMENL